jgi:hypothetical protein
VKGGRLTIAAVANETGVSVVTIHDRHPEIAEQIRALQGKGSRRQRDRKHGERQRVHEANRELRAQLAEPRADLEKLIPINETLALDRISHRGSWSRLVRSRCGADVSERSVAAWEGISVFNWTGRGGVPRRGR